MQVHAANIALDCVLRFQTDTPSRKISLLTLCELQTTSLYVC